MTTYSTAGRIAAGVTAAVAWLGLGLYLAAEIAGRKGDWPAALWTSLGFLTDLTNLGLATVMTGVALGSARLSRPVVVGGVVTAILMVGTGFWLIGGRLVPGQSALEDILLHGVTPLLALAVWLAFPPRGGVGWTSVGLWLIWPALYWPYALLRGGLTGDYAYGFLNWTKHGATGVALTLTLLVALHAVCGLAVVGIDRLPGRRRGREAELPIL